jgi:putative DNA primase/helicase
MTAVTGDSSSTPDVDDDTLRSDMPERAKEILDHNPELSRAGFNGKMFDRFALAPDVAGELYDELTGERGDVAGTHQDETTTEHTPPPEKPLNEHGDRPESDERQSIDDAITAHYDRLDDASVYADLGEIESTDAGTDCALSCLGNQDFAGWYRDRDAGGSWDGRARPYALSLEFDAIRDGLDRVLYATINYTPTDWFLDAWDRYEWVDSSREWQRGESPTPGYDDVLAYAPFADIDLADDVKTKRPAGDVPAGDLKDALARYIDAFADLAGGHDHVFALDSVGGAYVMVAPTSTAPIATEFTSEDRAVLFDELTDRLNEWLEDVGDRVTDTTGLGGVFEPDAVNHKNRLYKAPLSVHKSLDGVVTPIDTDAPRYEFTPFEDADSALVDETRAWIDGFTGDHRDAVDAIVATLWPEYYEDAESWDSALAAWLEDREDADQEHNERERKRIPTDEIPDDLETTDDLNVIESAVEGVNVETLARDVADSVNDDRDKLRFNPPWRPSSTGESCIADREKFADLKEGGGGGALKLVALDRGIIGSSTDDLTGRDYWGAVNALREEGYHIPYYEGSNGRHPDVLRLFTEPDGEKEKKQQLARALFADG